MCRRVECKACGRPTFAGCGAHVEQVLRDVPAADRCRCHEEKRTEVDERGRASWLSRLLGR
jgi:hypothetical protein